VNRPDAEIAELPTDPGARLRRQREHGGLTEQQVAERLNLDTGVVIALESDDYASLGAPVFVRGHFRRYATLLGVPAEEILGAYDRSRAQLAPPTLVPKSRGEMPRPRRHLVSPRFAAGALVFIVVAAIAAYIGEHGLRRPGAAGAAPGTVAAVPATPASRGAGAVAAVPTDQVALVFEFSADSWIEVYDGSGRTVLYDLGKAGTERAVSGVAPLSVTLGNAPGVALSVNGKRVAVPSPPSGETVARFGVVADGLQR
jgi:cytoskeleton protein RodZ